MRGSGLGLFAVYVAFAVGCYAPVVPEGTTCMPALENCPTGQRCILHGTVATCTSQDIDAPLADAVDSPPAIDAALTACPADPALGLCYGFDQPILASQLTNEGGFTVAAQLTSVTRIATATGGAAQLTAASEIYIPPNASITGISTIEARFRLDAYPPLDSRAGVADADPTTTSLSLFYYRSVLNVHEIRCDFGIANVLFVPITAPLGTYVDVACVCDAGSTIAYINGSKVGEHAGCSPGVATTYGLQIGANNNTMAGAPPDNRLVGAIDLLRMWTRALSPMEICQHAGGNGC